MDAEAEFVNMQLDAIGPEGSGWEGKAIPFGEHESGSQQVSMMNAFEYDKELFEAFDTRVERYMGIQEGLTKWYEKKEIAGPHISDWGKAARMIMYLSLAKIHMMAILLDTEDEVIDMLESAMEWHKNAHTFMFFTFTNMFQRPWNPHMVGMLDAISMAVSANAAELPDRIAARELLQHEWVETMVDFALWWLSYKDKKKSQVQELQFKMDGLDM